MSKFEFDCPNCGIHEVTEEQFYRLLSRFLILKFKNKFKAGAISARIKFIGGDGCPECRETGFGKIQAQVIWPKHKSSQN